MSRRDLAQAASRRAVAIARAFALALPLALALAIGTGARGQSVPPGFFVVDVASGWDQVVGITFAADGRLVAWERTGRVWVVVDGVKQNEPLIDISDEVGGWRDHGLLGLALHPNFLVNGYVYLLYVVDRHHLLHAGTPQYDPEANAYFAASIGRLTRYTARAEDDFMTIDPASRTVLVGEAIDAGFPITHQSHGIGTVLFGTDGTLLVSCGDGASYLEVDAGGQVEDGYVQRALENGILRAKEDVGAFRAQLVDCLNGKVLRLDPLTGDGLPSNPFYDGAAPRSPRSRVWCLGLRNPFRMALVPGSGSHDAADGDPGVLYVGDVGWGEWEELNVAAGPGLNFGWPIFEGLEPHSGYSTSGAVNPDAPNPLYPDPCPDAFLPFTALIQQDTPDPDPVFPNPCDAEVPLPPTLDLFVHERPTIDWRHQTGPARVGIFDEGEAAVVALGDPEAPVEGEPFAGNSSTGGVVGVEGVYPEGFAGSYFHGEFGGKWIRRFQFHENEHLHAVEPFLENGGNIVALVVHPVTGELHYARFGSTGQSGISRVGYAPSGDLPPIASAVADATWGPSPLPVQFTGSGSFDPEKEPLEFTWDFGDESPVSTDPDPLHVFMLPPGVPTRYDVTLTVTDPAGGSDCAEVAIFVNNSPPVVDITSIDEGDLYPLDGETVFPLEATVADAEHAAPEIECAWQTILHHNEHSHPEPVDPACTSSTTISPIGCGEETYFFEVVFTGTDPLGLAGSDVVFLFPDCDGVLACPADINGNGAVEFGDLVELLSWWGPCGACPSDLDGNGVVAFNDLLDLLSTWGPCP